jgi:hypothetical protein
VGFPNNQLRTLRNGFRVTRASLAGNAGDIAGWGAEISAAAAPIAEVTELFQMRKIQGFVGFFTMARRLLILWLGK